jgi:hypothetical protein
MHQIYNHMVYKFKELAQTHTWRTYQKNLSFKIRIKGLKKFQPMLGGSQNWIENQPSSHNEHHWVSPLVMP